MSNPALAVLGNRRRGLMISAAKFSPRNFRREIFAATPSAVETSCAMCNGIWGSSKAGNLINLKELMVWVTQLWPFRATGGQG